MNFSLKNHPFAVEAFFESSIVLTFAIPKEEIKHLIKEPLQLDVFDQKWAFIAIALVQTKKLRPKGFPKFMGNDFILAGYRVFVTYTNPKGKKFRGLYILKSETNKKKMEFLGNIFTHYNYSTTDISKEIKKNKNILLTSSKSKFEFLYSEEDPVKLPIDSPFNEWKEAKKYSGPLPYTFTINEGDDQILIIEGVRNNWKPRPINIEKYYFHFLEELGFSEKYLASAFIVENIPYSWKKGKTEKWK